MLVLLLQRRMMLIGCLFCFCVRNGVAGPSSKALFPAASRFKRDSANVTESMFHHSVEDVHLLFEILLAGVQFKDSGEFSVQDAELASLRKTRNLKVICEEIVPRKHADILQLISELSNHNEPLDQEDFECTLMTLVYTSQQVVYTTCEWQQQVWEESFVNLFKAIKQDLTDTS
ncbi:protein FAM180A-like [Nelusetta ayraudi]|uniref:protein FAM180A-like n=1 Tax=Nelusetta ayraudi TaxID=303726 RepID=UPI003F7069EF